MVTRDALPDDLANDSILGYLAFNGNPSASIPIRADAGLAAVGISAISAQAVAKTKGGADVKNGQNAR